MAWYELVIGGGLLVTVIGQVAWVTRLVGNHMAHRLDAIDKKLADLDGRLEKLEE